MDIGTERHKDGRMETHEEDVMAVQRHKENSLMSVCRRCENDTGM